MAMGIRGVRRVLARTSARLSMTGTRNASKSRKWDEGEWIFDRVGVNAVDTWRSVVHRNLTSCTYIHTTSYRRLLKLCEGKDVILGGSHYSENQLW
jgi:hypothetical protein